MALQILRVLDLSTAHLTQVTCGKLWRGEFGSTAVEAPALDAAFAVIRIPEPDGDHDPVRAWPIELNQAARFAQANDCQFIKFDRDADTVDGLTVYEW